MKSAIFRIAFIGLLLFPVALQAQDSRLAGEPFREHMVPDVQEMLAQLETLRSSIKSRIDQENGHIDDLVARLDREASPNRREVLRSVIESSWEMSIALDDQLSRVDAMIEQLQGRLRTIEP